MCLLTKFALGDRVRLLGSVDVYEIDEIQDLADGEVRYWVVLKGEIPTRVFVKEADLESIEKQQRG